MFRDRTFWGLNLAVLLMMIGVGMNTAVLLQRIVALDGSGQSVGYLASAFALSYILLQVPIGSLADRFGFKPFLFLGYLLCGVVGLVFFFAPNSGWIFFGRLVQGVGEAPAWALAAALLSVKYPLQKGRVIGCYNAAVHLGLTVGPLIGIVLARLLENQAVFLVYSVCCLTGGLIIALLVEPLESQGNNDGPSWDYRSLLKLANQRQTGLALIGITLYGACYGSFLTTIPVFLLQEKGLGAVAVNVLFALFYAAISLSQLVTGGLTDRYGRRNFMVFGLLAAAGGMAVTPGLNMPAVLAALTAASLGLGVFYLASLGYLNEIVPNELKGTISGAYYLFWGIGVFFGPPVMTWLAAANGSRVALLAYAAAMTLVAAGLLSGRPAASSCSNRKSQNQA